MTPGQTVFYSSTVENFLPSRYAEGLLETSVPVAGRTDLLAREQYQLAPSQSGQLSGTVTVPAAITTSQQVTVTTRAGADIVDLRAVADQRTAWLRLDENPGATTFFDFSLSGNPAACSGAACPTASVDGYAGKAIRLNGAGQYLTLPSADTLGLYSEGDYDQQAFTVMAWVKGSQISQGSGVQSVVATDSSTLGDDSFSWQCSILNLGVQGGKPFLGFYQADLTGQTVLQNNQWYHLAFRYDYYPKGTTALQARQTIFVNGAVDARQDDSRCGGFIGNYPVLIGRSPDGSTSFNGLVDEVEIYPRALTDAEIQARVKDPVLHLPFDSAIADTSAFQHAVTVDPATGAQPTLGYSGPTGANLDFPSNNYTQNSAHGGVVKISPDRSLDLSGGSFTQAFWVRPATPPFTPADVESSRFGLFGAESIADARSDTNAYPFAQLVYQTTADRQSEPITSSAKLRVGFGSTSAETGYLLPVQTWSHVAIVYGAQGQNTGYQVYVNGALAFTKNFASPAAPATIDTGSPLVLGRAAVGKWVHYADSGTLRN